MKRTSDTRVFISYRRSDSLAAAGRIYDKLSQKYGSHNVFKDDSISPGAQFDVVIDNELKNAHVLLVIIGPEWIATKDSEGNPRLQNLEDPVRREILKAKQLAMKIIPLLVDGASMPDCRALPEELVFLSFYNALKIRNDRDFEGDIKALFLAISRRRQNFLALAAIAILLLAFGLFLSIKSGFFLSNSANRSSDKSDKKSNRSILTQDGIRADVPPQRIRLGLVIGNKTYSHLPSLSNASNDAEGVAACLKNKGFRMFPNQIDKSTEDIRKALGDFQTLLALGGTGIVFYAGHGVQINGEDYIVPIDAKVSTLNEVRLHCINVSEIMRPVEGKLEDTPLRSGDMIIYSTAKGGVALDGTGSNSPFAKCFIEAAQVEEYEIFDLFRHLCAHVPAETNGEQTPWISASTRVEFFLNNQEKDQEIGILKMLIFDTCRENPVWLSAR